MAWRKHSLLSLTMDNRYAVNSQMADLELKKRPDALDEGGREGRGNTDPVYSWELTMVLTCGKQPGIVLPSNPTSDAEQENS